MKIKDNSIVDTVIDYANVKFGLELTADFVSSQLKNLSFSETLKLVDSIKTENDEAFSTIIDISSINEAPSYGPSRATIRSQGTDSQTANRRANNAQQDAQRDSTAIARNVAGGNKQPTGQGASRMPSNADPDDVERAQNAQVAGQASNQANYNSQEIERLKQLIQGR